jgi:hypothetical protein
MIDRLVSAAGSNFSMKEINILAKDRLSRIGNYNKAALIFSPVIG